ncbi:MAG: organic solvent tolerance protein OstA [Pirellula sp.]
MERIPLTDPIRIIRSLLLSTRQIHLETNSTAHFVGGGVAHALFSLMLAIFLAAADFNHHLHAAEIGVPLSDPKFGIEAFAHSATKRTQGVFEVYTLSGGCRIYQGAFMATCDTANIWIDRSEDGLNKSESPDRSPNAKKVIVQTLGNCDVRWSDEQRISDSQWMGRLFSHFDVGFHADVWNTATGEGPDLDWNADSPARRGSPSGMQATGQVRNAIAWSADDHASHVKLASQITSMTPIPSPLPRGNEVSIQFNPSNTSAPGTASDRGRIPSGDSGSQNNGASLINGNLQLGGTVLDAGSMQLFESTRPANEGAVPQSVQSFQVPNSMDLGPAPVAAPVAFGSPNASPGRQRIGARTFEFSGRGGVGPTLDRDDRPDRGDSVITIAGGIRLRFGQVSAATSTGVMDLGTVLIEADRAVIWTPNATKLMSKQIDDMPVEVYIEGNVVFQQGQRVVYADRMYYNVQAEYGMILGAEILTPAPQYEGLLRLKADVVEQRSRETFLAYRGALTSSRLGVPRYWLQSDRIELTDRKNTNNGTLFGLPFAGTTGEQTGMQAKARHNFVYLAGLPVFYWPILNSNVDTSNFYVSGLRFKNDTILGNQVMVDWDLYQILGIQGLDGTRWTLSTDYLSKRGIGVGTNFRYNVPNLFVGPAVGTLDLWGLQDKGLDFIGSDRSGLTPEQDTRGRLLFQHRQYLSPDTELWAEAGFISDRNFLEQYFEQEWDTQKDYSTALRLRQYYDQHMIDIWGQTRLNKFLTETEWLPRLDHYWLGQTVGDIFTYYSHSNIGYARQRVASTPTNPAEIAKFQLQPWEVNAGGLHAVTRHELNLPFDTGYYKFVPFLSGEAGKWGEDVNGQDITRLTGQAGLRSSLPMVKVFPDVQSSTLNLSGLAHKLSFESEFLYADTTQDLDLFPLYNPIDDNSQEHFRRRLVFNTFGGVLPDQFESTNYAARQAMQRYMSAASSEVVTNQFQSRFGIHQRWQTKRGVPGRERIADVVEFDVDAIIFGKPDRDNFGQSVGGINYDFRYHIGDRVTLLSNGYYDLFESGLRATTLGGVISRPGRGDIYLGATSIEGPFSSMLLTTSFNYRMNEKWVAVGGTTVDLGKTGNIGQSLGLTRIGESFLIRVGANVDSGRDNVSYNFNIEPRFLSTRGLGVVAGQLIPPAGLYGLE